MLDSLHCQSYHQPVWIQQYKNEPIIDKLVFLQTHHRKNLTPSSSPALPLKILHSRQLSWRLPIRKSKLQRSGLLMLLPIDNMLHLFFVQPQASRLRASFEPQQGIACRHAGMHQCAKGT